MKKKIALVVVCITLATMLAGCQWATKQLGGSYTVELPEDQKLVNVSWNDADLWYLTRPMTEDDVAETYTFVEDNNYGVKEGTVTIIETKSDGGK